MCVQRGRPAKTAFLPPPPLVEEGCSTAYFNLPGTVWDSVRVPQVVFGDGRSPFKVLLVRARAGYAVRRQQSSHCGRSVFFMATKRSSLHKPVRVLLSVVSHALTRLEPARWTTAVARGEGLITEGAAAAMSCVTCIASGSQSVRCGCLAAQLVVCPA